MTEINSANSGYTGTAKFLHWVLAAALIGIIFFGWYMTNMPFSPTRLKYFNWHKWAGITILALCVIRLLWRITHRPPDLPAAMQARMPTWQKAAHHGVHHLMYALFFIVPLMGWAYSSAAGYPVVLFGAIPLPDFVGKSPELAQALKPWHGRLAWLLTALIVVHIAAVVKHQVIDRDGLLGRMLPGQR